MGLALVAALGGGGRGVGEEVPAAGAPQIVCDAPVYNFGDVSSGTLVTHTYRLRNAGTAPLEIGAVRTSCGCTTASLTTHTVPPDGHVDLTVQLSLLNRHGPQHKSVFVESNDPANPRLVLALEGVSRQAIRFEPPSLGFTRLGPNEPAERSVKVIVDSNYTIRVTGIVLEPGPFAGTVETIEEGRSYRLHLRVGTPHPRGRFGTTAYVMTDREEFNRLPLPVYANVLPDLLVAPTALMLGPPGGPATTSAALTVYSPQAVPFTVKGVDTPDPRIAVQVLPPQAGRVRIELSDIPVDPALNGKGLRIRTDVGGSEELSVPIVVRSR